MGRCIQRNGPIDHRVLLGDPTTCEMFRRRGWLDYCLSLKGFNEEVSCQFMTTLRDGVVVVKDLRIKFSEEMIVEVTRLPQEGKNWEKEFAT